MTKEKPLNEKIEDLKASIMRNAEDGNYGIVEQLLKELGDLHKEAVKKLKDNLGLLERGWKLKYKEVIMSIDKIFGRFE